ncbi:MAG: 23S rRNA (adenine(2503)-C(2))-methyltransferase RlmN [Patescibacteria group bacterium]
MDILSLKKALKDKKEPGYRLSQAKRSFYVEFQKGWDSLSTYPEALRNYLKDQIPWDALNEIKTLTAKDGSAVKKLFSCSDGSRIESVLMRHEDGRNTVCVSCQVGCPMGCAFCATGSMGFKRNLNTNEIVEQVIWFSRHLKEAGAKITNVVFMGMGEPLNNYEQVIGAVKLLNDPDGLNLGARHMTISTSGIVPGILKLANEPWQVNLAVSLHSAIDETRSQLMPVNKAYPIAELMKAIEKYAEITNRKIFFEYLLIENVNDDQRHVHELIELLAANRRLYHLNLIKYHDTGKFKATNKIRFEEFKNQMQAARITTTERVSFGEDIDAACGQLAIKSKQ